MLLLGIDIGTSFVKVAVVDAATRTCLASISYPDTERPVIVAEPGWAEQPPEQWWADVQEAIRALHQTGRYRPREIGAVGITYQMHGLVLLGKWQEVLRNAIIWCDSRGVPFGRAACSSIGLQRCLDTLLNDPGNFTASKLAWVKTYEPGLYRDVAHVLLPGDYISFRLTGEVVTTVTGLSEGMFWDFSRQQVSEDLLNYFGFDETLLPAPRPVFSTHGELLPSVARNLSLPPGIPVSYKAGDQPTNAFSLNVLREGDVAATAGTSGVVYAPTLKPVTDAAGRINSFAHVNFTPDNPMMGVLLCLNSAGFSYAAMRQRFSPGTSYDDLNRLAARVAPGAGGLLVMPFGNGAERMLGNRSLPFQLIGYNPARHTTAHLMRAVQEGIVFAFRHGTAVLKSCGVRPERVRAARANLFLSPVFTQCFADTLGLPLELYQTNGAIGAALGAGVGAGVFASPEEAIGESEPVSRWEPDRNLALEESFQNWQQALQGLLAQNLL